MAKAFHGASRVMTIAIEMVAPGLIGIWLDKKFNTKVLFTLLGFAGGLALALWHLVQIARARK